MGGDGLTAVLCVTSSEVMDGDRSDCWERVIICAWE